MAERIIYDLGANRGDNIPYYLQKAERVVAVEANPDLAAEITRRFSPEIMSGRLCVESVVLVDTDDAPGECDFYIHKTNSVLSQMGEPQGTDAASFRRISLPTRSAASIVSQYGSPHYVKIDIEGCDDSILRNLFHHGIRPSYISAESHTIDVFCSLCALGGYRAFKLVDGESVSSRYANHPVQVIGGQAKHSFPDHSAGPFGQDVAGPWMTRDNFFSLLGHARLGWKDIHASNIDQPDPTYAPAPFVQIGINF